MVEPDDGWDRKEGTDYALPGDLEGIISIRQNCSGEPIDCAMEKPSKRHQSLGETPPCIANLVERLCGPVREDRHMRGPQMLVRSSFGHSILCSNIMQLAGDRSVHFQAGRIRHEGQSRIEKAAMWPHQRRPATF